MITEFKIFEKKDKGSNVIYTLKTKAETFSNSNIYKYDVNIILDYKSDSDFYQKLRKEGYDLILSIEGTPASWYLKTLLYDSPNLKYSNRISIQGNYWYCENWQEIYKELIEIEPFLLDIADSYENAEKYNL